MPGPARSSAARTLVDALLVAGTKLVASLVVLAMGFRAVSDDDYARVVIAERFARAPSWDPSGTSWLPLPFWLYGSSLAAFGRTLVVARATALALALASGVLVWVAARWVGAGRRAALAAGMLGAVIPHAAWLGVATVPEAPTAALTLLGAASLASDTPRVRALGALALAAATLSRYEAWPVALVFALFCGFDAARGRFPLVALLSAALALAPALTWMLHGHLTHRDAWFFVARVRAYERALGAPIDPLAVRLFRAPLALVRYEPEIALLTVTATLMAALARSPSVLLRHVRPTVAAGAVVAFLVVSDVRSSGATHHAERSLLAVWLLSTVVVADVTARLWPAFSRRGRVVLTLSAFVATTVVSVALRLNAPEESFAERRTEMAIGTAARDRLEPADRLLVDTPDYGFFAVIAGFGAPERAEPLDDRDPRHARSADPLASDTAFESFAVRHPGAWLVTSRARAQRALPRARPAKTVGDFVLVPVRSAASSN